jgi:hypothetical protein
MKTYRSLTLKTVLPQLHHPNIKYCSKVRPLPQEEGREAWKEAEDLESDTKLQPADTVIYCQQGLFFTVSFTIGR